jgi:hypothetical protein
MSRFGVPENGLVILAGIDRIDVLAIDSVLPADRAATCTRANEAAIALSDTPRVRSPVTGQAN